MHLAKLAMTYAQSVDVAKLHHLSGFFVLTEGSVVDQVIDGILHVTEAETVGPRQGVLHRVT